MVNGFQRQFESRIFTITETRTEIEDVESQIAQHAQRIAEYRDITVDKVRADHSAELDRIREERESAIAALEAARRDALDRVSQTETTALEAEMANKSEQIQSLRAEMNAQIASLDRTYEAANSTSANQTEAQRRVLEGRLQRLDQELTNVTSAYQRELDECGVFCSADGIHERYTAQLEVLKSERRDVNRELSALAQGNVGSDLRSEHQERISAIRNTYAGRMGKLADERAALANEIDNRRSRSEDAVRPIIARMDARRAEIIANAQKSAEEMNDRFSLRLKEAENREIIVAGLQNEKAALEIRRNELRNKVNQSAKENQIYQIASLWFGRDAPVDVTKEELKIVSSIWFGSLALIVALMGTILAFAGLVVRYQVGNRNRSGERRPTLWRTIRTVRGAAVDLRLMVRRRLREGPRVITKEVPVDKVVFKDVPREVVRKELVYVPLYTNDPELLQVWDGLKSGRDKPEAPISDKAAADD